MIFWRWTWACVRVSLVCTLPVAQVYPMCSLAQGCPSPSLWPHRQDLFPLMLKPNRLSSCYLILPPPAMSEREQRANQYRQSMWMYCVCEHITVSVPVNVCEILSTPKWLIITFIQSHTLTHACTQTRHHMQKCSTSLPLIFIGLITVCFVGTCR